jgi:hypothetical protein
MRPLDRRLLPSPSRSRHSERLQGECLGGEPFQRHVNLARGLKTLAWAMKPTAPPASATPTHVSRSPRVAWAMRRSKPRSGSSTSAARGVDWAESGHAFEVPEVGELTGSGR